MKFSSLFFAFLCIVLQACGQPNPQYNGSFEKLDPQHRPDGWHWDKVKEASKSYIIGLDSLVKQDGKYSLSIVQNGENPSFGSAIYEISHTFKGKEIELKGYLKTENVANGFAGLWMRIDGLDGVLSFDNMNRHAITGTTEWTEYSIKLPYDDQNSNKITIGGLLAGKGKIWIDNLRLYIDGVPIENVAYKTLDLMKAQRDTAFSMHSGIDTIIMNKQEIINLTLLGQVWGFLKYHHPAVAKGDYNFDAELFRIMPKVIKAKDNDELSDALERWVGKFEKPVLCTSCATQPSDAVAFKPEYGSVFNSKILKKSLIDKLDYILKNHNFTDSYYVGMVSQVGNPIFKHELPYNMMVHPDAGFRLLCLYRYWNMIQYFYPYKHLIGSNWDNVLSEFITRFANASDKTGYVVTTLALISSIHDTHANIWSYNPVLEDYRGIYALPLQAKFIENHLVVTGYYLDTLNVKRLFYPGDIITGIDGEKIEKLILKYLPITAASNYATQLRDMPNNYLLRSNKKSLALEIIHDGKTKTITINTVELGKLNKSIDFNPRPTDPADTVLNDKIAYLFPGKYKNQDLPAIKEKFTSTKGMIIDMRCYPSDFMPFTFVPYIKTGSSDFVKFTLGSIEKPGLFTIQRPISVTGTNEYKGKVVIIVNELTQSQAEYTTMAFQSASNVTVIGSTTAGADGNVSNITLPGGISTLISGIDILYPDGTETQRKGIKINVEIKPSIKGVSVGEDELLEKAKEIILDSK